MSKDDIIGILLIIIGWFIIYIPLGIKTFSIEFWCLLVGVGLVSMGHLLK